MARKLLLALSMSAALPVLLPGLAHAENRAILFQNQDYARLPDLRGADFASVGAAFKAAGYRTVEGRNLTGADMRGGLADLLRPDTQPGSRAVVLQGRFVHSRGDTWLLGQGADGETLVSAGPAGIALSVVTELAEGGRPWSVVLLATDETPFATGPGLSPGIGPIAARPGVTVIAGPPPQIAKAAASLAQGGSIAAAMSQGAGLRVLAGAKPAPSTPVVAPSPAQSSRPVVASSDAVDMVQPDPDEQAAWTRAKRSNSVAGYREFLSKYPRSLFAGAARGRMEELDAAAAAPRTDGPAATEAALRLTRAQQAQIQRQLALLTYDPQNIDGVFTAATRQAIGRFQRDAGMEPTGYLTGQQIDVLARAAAIRSRQLEDDATRRQAAEKAADDAFWAQQRRAGPDGATAYLQRYPDGRHRDAARKIMASVPQSEASEDDRLWQQSKSLATLDAMRRYIATYPKGRHVDEARTTLAAMEKQRAKDRADEAAMDLSVPVRMVIEQRLDALGMRTGKVDGTFDSETRTAIRRYQKARNLRVSGFMNQATAVRLLADTLLAQD